MIALTQFTIGLFPRFRIFSRSPMGITYQIGATQVYWYLAWINYVALGIAIILYLVSFISIVIKVRSYLSLKSQIYRVDQILLTLKNVFLA
mgnify:CR=1 FL=1